MPRINPTTKGTKPRTNMESPQKGMQSRVSDYQLQKVAAMGEAKIAR